MSIPVTEPSGRTASQAWPVVGPEPTPTSSTRARLQGRPFEQGIRDRLQLPLSRVSVSQPPGGPLLVPHRLPARRGREGGLDTRRFLAHGSSRSRSLVTASSDSHAGAGQSCLRGTIPRSTLQWEGSDMPTQTTLGRAVEPRVQQSGEAVPAAVRAQILATEHWSLLGTRGTTWTEVMGRISIHLTVASAGSLRTSSPPGMTGLGSCARTRWARRGTWSVTLWAVPACS
jgi:hypothetical protein